MENSGETKVTVETTTGMMMGIGRFNQLSEIEKANTVVPEGVRLVIIKAGEEMGIVVPSSLTLERIFYAWVQMFGKPGIQYSLHSVRESNGAMLETTRPIGEMKFKPWERLFIEVLESNAG